MSTHSRFQSDSPHGNVVFNFRRNPAGELAAWGAGNRRAARLLVQALQQASGYRCNDVYPIFFLYRHALELYLKAVVHEGAVWMGFVQKEWKVPERLFSDHRLSRLLPPIREVFESLEWTWDFDISGLRSFDDFAAFVRSVEEIDEKSLAFRYPVTKDGTAALPHHFVLNVFAFAQSMEQALDILDAAVTGLQEAWQSAAESIEETRLMCGELNP